MNTKTRGYLAYPCSEQLLADSKTLIATMGAENPTKDGKLLASTLCLFSDETLDAYLVDIFHSLALTQSQSKVLEIGESAIRSTSHGLIKGLAKKLDLSQHQRIAQHLEAILHPLSRQSIHEAAFIAFPIEAGFHDQLLLTYQQANPQKNLEQLIDNQVKVIDLMFSALVNDLLSQLKLGPIASKLATIARDSCLQLMRSTTEKLLKNMSEEELRTTCQNFQEMLISPAMLDREFILSSGK